MNHSLPILFFNLTGEMIYILDHRLRSQNIEAGKAAKVLSDMIVLVTGSRFVENLMKPQPLHSSAAVRSMFERLACGSIMSMGRESMDKLYDLMTMVFKYQVEMCSEPADILTITENHFLQMAALAPNSQLSTMLHSVRNRLSQVYSRLSTFEQQEIRYYLLNFLQDNRVRVSILLREKLQNPDATFPLQPIGLGSLGEIHYYDHRGEILKTTNYPVTEIVMPSIGQNQQHVDSAHNSARLGQNIYSWGCVQPRAPSDLTCSPSGESAATDYAKHGSDFATNNETVPDSSQGMACSASTADSNILLRRLIGQHQPVPAVSSHSPHVFSFKLNLFGTSVSRSSDVISPDTRRDSTKSSCHVDPRLNQLMNDLTFNQTEPPESDCELLDWLPNNVQ